MAKQKIVYETKISKIQNRPTGFVERLPEAQATDVEVPIIITNEESKEATRMVDLKNLKRSDFENMPIDTKTAIFEAHKYAFPESYVKYEVSMAPKAVLNISQSIINENNLLTQQLVSTYRGTIKPLGKLKS